MPLFKGDPRYGSRQLVPASEIEAIVLWNGSWGCGSCGSLIIRGHHWVNAYGDVCCPLNPPGGWPES
jgi:hypothetical protein